MMMRFAPYTSKHEFHYHLIINILLDFARVSCYIINMLRTGKIPGAAAQQEELAGLIPQVLYI
jgi:hypothetical protein